MLTARSSATSPLDVIRLTLEMLFAARPVPQSLQAHFNSVLATARAVSANPQHPPREADTEAIYLAFEIMARESLQRELREVNVLEDIDRDRAGRLLAEMEQATVYP